jgi:hypothetical protein
LSSEIEDLRFEFDVLVDEFLLLTHEVGVLEEVVLAFQGTRGTLFDAG